MYSSQSDTEQCGACAPYRQTTFMRAGHNASWSTFLTADVKFGLHTLALLLHRQRKLEKRIRSLEQTLHRSRQVVNQLFVRFHADVPENTAASVRCSIWRSGSGTSESTFGFFLEPEPFQLESHSSRDAVFSRRQHHWLRLVVWCLVQLHCWLLFGWLVASLLNGSIVLVIDDLYRRLRLVAERLLFWCFCHSLHIGCPITFLTNLFFSLRGLRCS